MNDFLQVSPWNTSENNNSVLVPKYAFKSGTPKKPRKSKYSGNLLKKNCFSPFHHYTDSNTYIDEYRNSKLSQIKGELVSITSRDNDLQLPQLPLLRRREDNKCKNFEEVDNKVAKGKEVVTDGNSRMKPLSLPTAQLCYPYNYPPGFFGHCRKNQSWPSLKRQPKHESGWRPQFMKNNIGKTASQYCYSSTVNCTRTKGKDYKHLLNSVHENKHFNLKIM